MWWYNLGIHAFDGAARILALWKPKAAAWCRGRKGIFEKMRSVISPTEDIIWVHAASLGEFEQGRPVIEALRRTHPEYKILLTFFSPSGYEIRKNYSGADYIFYLPSDTPRNVRRFMDIVRPKIAIIIKYEFWLNYLSELRRRGCRTYIISSIFRRDSIFFRPYGWAFRRALRSFDTLFVQNDESVRLLASIGITDVEKTGDTRFDRVADIVSKAGRIEEIERFADGDTVFVAGSTWPPDEELIINLANRHKDTKFIIVPHEIDSERIDRMAQALEGGAVRYTRAAECDNLSAAQVMIVDTVGILSSVYAYAGYAYIGGGFGVGIHNTLEAATFSLPLAFGPNYAKFKEAADLISLGAARSVNDYTQLEEWFTALHDDKNLRKLQGEKAGRYIQQNKGATDKILSHIFR